ncbi:hypothetical protein ACUN0C_14405 [Faunimonas sp. B44]|uniref:hypothetical protein n=1 Tax=Faunimonas sp. B44 TaxID=3461493 RepID=UPI004043F4D1
MLGWHAGQPPRTAMPPKDCGSDGRWVEIGPGAVFLTCAPPDWAADFGEPILARFVLGRVAVDGAAAPVFALLRLDQGDDLPKRGARLVARFAGEAQPGDGAPDFWFEPVSGSSMAAGDAP